jgi:hypothetical protein
MSHKQITEWCRKNDVWYLKMDIEIPEVCIKEAQSVYDEGYFVDHRFGDGDGWCSASIHSFVHRDEPDTRMGWHHTKNPDGHGFNENHVKWGWTEIAEIAPETKRWLEDFPHKKNSYRRLRFMLLEPKGSIKQHHDSNTKRDREGRRRNISGAINIAFYQPDNCYMRRVFEDELGNVTDRTEELPFENCTGFWFDNGVMHEAYNASDENRYHFIMHGGFNKEREELMKRSLVKQFGKDILREIDE